MFIYIKVEKKIKADRTRLFKAWINTENFARWFLSGEGVGIESVDMDTRVGGSFHINMILKGKILPHQGEYKVIDEPSKLVFTWRSDATNGRDTLVTVTFKTISENSSKESFTLITLVHERLISDLECEMHRGGWTSILDAMSSWFEAKE